MKLLSVHMLTSGAGEAQAAAVFQLINDDWHLKDRIQVMFFDTTTSNNGSKTGECTLLRHKLQKPLISLSCRHHIHELTVARVIDLVMVCSSGPNIKFFERFPKAWLHLDRSNFQSSSDDQSVAVIVRPQKTSLIHFFRQQLQEFKPRDDYKELLQLSLFSW